MSCPQFRNVPRREISDDRRPRTGFSMFEVMVAMAVCVSGIVLIIGMMQTAENYTQRAQSRMTQQLLCQNLMNQVLLGIVEPREMRREECPANEDFWYSMRVNRYPHLPMQRIEIAVWPKTNSERAGGSRVESIADPATTTAQASGQSEEDAKKFVLVCLLPTMTREGADSSVGQNRSTIGNLPLVGGGSDRLPPDGNFDRSPIEVVPPW